MNIFGFCCSVVQNVLQCVLQGVLQRVSQGGAICVLQCVLQGVLQGALQCVMPKVLCVAVERGRDHHHDDLILQPRAAVCCSVVPRVAVCCLQPLHHVPSLPAQALLPLAVYPRPPLPRRQWHAPPRLQCRGSCSHGCRRT